MKKMKLLIPLVILVCIGCLFAWYGMELELADQLPREEWTRAEVRPVEAGVGAREVVLEDPQALLEAIADTTVTRRQEFHSVAPGFEILLYRDEGYPTLMYVVDNGSISIAKELDLDHYTYYEGGQDLYRKLLELTEKP